MYDRTFFHGWRISTEAEQALLNTKTIDDIDEVFNRHAPYVFFSDRKKIWYTILAKPTTKDN